MRFPEFHDLHLPALERDQARHNILLTILAAIRGGDAPEGRWWSLGGPGACALAEELREDDVPAVLGPDLTAKWFVARAAELGFGEAMPQRILALSAPPRDPGVPGEAREVTAADAALFADWLTAFHRETVPQDAPPEREALERKAGQGDHVFWEVEGRPLSLAGIVRRTTACLYCDLANPAAKRCYAKLGFAPVCDSWFYPRQAG